MLLASQATPAGATVYAHTNNRCGNFVSFEGAACVYYRIEDAQLTETPTSNRTEITGHVRGMDGMDFPMNKGCQIFFRLKRGDEVVLFTDSHSIQSLFEVAFVSRSEATVVYEDDGARNTVLQIRFNQDGPA